MTVARGKKEDCEVTEDRALLADPQVKMVDALVTAVRSTTRNPPCASSWTKAATISPDTKENTSKRLASAALALKDTPF